MSGGSDGERDFTYYLVHVIVPILAGSGVIIVFILSRMYPSPSPPTLTPERPAAVSSTDIPTPTLSLIPSPTPGCTGRIGGKPDSEQFSVYPNYDPSGYMGDIGDVVSVQKYTDTVGFKYEAMGRGPHEWEYKYVGGELNPDPARFAGVIYLCYGCGWGSTGGYDLRSFRRAIAWEARSLSGEVNVEFIIGGVDRVWDEKEKKQVSPQCPDSLRRKPLGTYTVTEAWQSFEVALADIPEEEFVNVIGGFAWVITWGSNEIELNPTATPPAPREPRTLEIEIRNIRYER